MKNNSFKSGAFVQINSAAEELNIHIDEILDAASSGQINLAVFAGKWLAWEAEHNPEANSPITTKGASQLLENTFLFIHSGYIERFRDVDEQEMGMFRSTQKGPVDRWCAPRKGKYLVRRDSLRILRSELTAFSKSRGIAPRGANHGPWKPVAWERGKQILLANPPSYLLGKAAKIIEQEFERTGRTWGNDSRKITYTSILRALAGLKGIVKGERISKGRKKDFGQY